MNLLMLHVIQSCNIHCKECPMRNWLYPIDSEHNRLNNTLLFKWLEKYCPPHKWCIEITGGEPSIYPEINELIEWLCGRGYNGIIRTNGKIPLSKTKNFKLIVGWHKGIPLETPPENVDCMVITRNPEDNWQAKNQYCIDNNIPFRSLRYENYSDRSKDLNDEPVPGTYKVSEHSGMIKNLSVVYSSGRLGACSQQIGSLEDNVQNMTPPMLKEVRNNCPQCVNVRGFEMYFSSEEKVILNKRRNDIETAKILK